MSFWFAMDLKKEKVKVSLSMAPSWAAIMDLQTKLFSESWQHARWVCYRVIPGDISRAIVHKYRDLSWYRAGRMQLLLTINYDRMLEFDWPCVYLHSIYLLLMNVYSGKLTPCQQTIYAQRMLSCWRDLTATLWSLTHQDKPLSSYWTTTKARKSTKQGTVKTIADSVVIVAFSNISFTSEVISRVFSSSGYSLRKEPVSSTILAKSFWDTFLFSPVFVLSLQLTGNTNS